MEMEDSLTVKELDWYKSKPVVIQKRGSMALASSFFIKKEEIIVNTKQRYVWPNSFAVGNSKVTTKRIWGDKI